MTVQWATLDTFCKTGTFVKYGKSAFDMVTVIDGLCHPFQIEGQMEQSNHIATFVNLSASTTYFYSVGTAIIGGDWSPIYHFHTAPNAETLSSNLPQRFLVYGDLGATSPDKSSTIMPWASKEVQDGRVDMILHVGDFAYDLFGNQGLTGRQFMNEISNMSAYVPYMVDHGNHESDYNFAHYTEFFRGQPSNLIHDTVVTDNGVAPNNWYFSWNVGLVHFVTISSEIYFDYPDLISSQWDWLGHDLTIANSNRSSAPWIIVHGHRSLYCSTDSDCDSDAVKLRTGIIGSNGSYEYGLAELFHKHGVDLYINGHEHNYERMFDISPMETFDYLAGVSTFSTVNPPATTFIITGDAGQEEGHKEFVYDQPERTAYRTSAYGYR